MTVALRLCEGKNCKKKQRKSVWLVDLRPMCDHCFEVWLNMNDVFSHSIHRLSEDDRDFPMKTHMCSSKQMASV